MKHEFQALPASMAEMETYGFSWMDYVTAIPSPLFVATSYKSNGKPNACLSSWSSLIGDGDRFYCVMASVSKNGHLYQTVQEKKELVLNFPSADVYGKCLATVENNGFEDDEIALVGLTAEPATLVEAPRLRECFLNLECRYAWEKELTPGGGSVVMCLEICNICMDGDHLDEARAGRYGDTGYLYNVHHPVNPVARGRESDSIAVLKKLSDIYTYREE